MTATFCRSVLWTFLLLIHLLSKALAQYGGPPPQVSCFRYFGMAEGAVQSLGVTNDDLCATTGQLWSLISTGQACMSRTVTSVPVGGFDLLNTALQLCNSEVGRSVSSQCAELTGQEQPCPLQSSYFGQAILAVATTTDVESGALVPNTQTSTNFITLLPATASSTGITSTSDGLYSTNRDNLLVTTSTSVPTSNSLRPATSPTDLLNGVQDRPAETEERPSVGLIVGVAVGAALGTVTLILTLLIFIWRYRRKSRSERIPIMFQSPPQRPPRPPSTQALEPKQEPWELESPTAERQDPERAPPYASVLNAAQGLDNRDAQMYEISVGQTRTGNQRVSGMRTWYSSGTSADGGDDHRT